ncbi:hypothetical protein L4D20_07640 [Vibrio kyushuensis]|uniref:hypothetical protein n=1 Tax=Vibrio TaxID=662 RepID=UPI003D1021D2
MKKLFLSIILLVSTNALANTIHISPDFRIGPHLGSGVAGGGFQYGLADTLGLEALYASYSHTSSEILRSHTRLETYRVGGQFPVIPAANISLQIEAGVVKYEGTRNSYTSDEVRYGAATGASISAAWVIFVNDNLGFRLGGDFNFIDQNKSTDSHSVYATIATGVVFQF